FFLLRGRPPSSPLFPYTTLFRSGGPLVLGAGGLRQTLRRLRAAEEPVELGGLFHQLPCGLRVGGPVQLTGVVGDAVDARVLELLDRKSTRLNSSHVKISYAVFCL